MWRKQNFEWDFCCSHYNQLYKLTVLITAMLYSVILPPGYSNCMLLLTKRKQCFGHSLFHSSSPTALTDLGCASGRSYPAEQIQCPFLPHVQWPPASPSEVILTQPQTAAFWHKQPWKETELWSPLDWSHHTEDLQALADYGLFYVLEAQCTELIITGIGPHYPNL